MRRMRAEQMMRLARANSWAEEHRSPADPRPRRRLRGRAAAVVGRPHRRPACRPAAQRPGRAVRARRPAGRRPRRGPGRLHRLRPQRPRDQLHRGQADGGAEHRLGPPRRRGQRRHRRAGRRHVPRRPRPRRGDRRQPRQQGRQGPRRDRRRRRPELRVRLAGRGRGVRRRAVREADARRRPVGVRRTRRADGRHRRGRRRLPRRPQRPAHAASRASCAWRARSTSTSVPSRSTSAARPARRYDFDSQRDDALRRRLGLRAASTSRRPATARPAAPSCRPTSRSQLVFDDDGNVSELDLGGTFGGEASVGIEAFLNGTNADSATPETLSLSAAGGADVRFDAKLDLQDPIVQQRAADAAQRHEQRWRCRCPTCRPCCGSPRCRCRSTPTSTLVGQLGHRHRQPGDRAEPAAHNAFTWVKPPAATSPTSGTTS